MTISMRSVNRQATSGWPDDFRFIGREGVIGSIRDVTG
jgi:hypothetical protein